MYKQK